MIPAARLPGSQRMRSTPVGPTSSVATAASALVRIGAAAKYPSVRRAASASRRRSMARGASPTGGAALAAFAAAATLAWPSGPLSQIAASNASRYVSRERLGFSDSSWVAALSSKCSLRPAPLVECDLPPEMFRQSPPQVGRGVGFDGWQERERCLQGAGITLRRRGGQRTVGAPPRVGGQQRGPL